MDDSILARSEGGVGRLTLNRPDQRNALTPEMLALLGVKLREMDSDPQTRCIILDAAGDHFVAGGDMNAWANTLSMSPHERGREFKGRFGHVFPLIDTLGNLGCPLIVAVKGYAVGGGLCFVLAADFVIADETAKFMFANIRAGINPDLGLTYFLPRIVGRRKAYQLTLLGSQIDVKEAQDIGIVDEIAPEGEIDAAVDTLTRKILAAPARAASTTKRLMNVSPHNTLTQQFWAEADGVARCAKEEDFIEAVSAFLERRQPQFGQGK